jgi:hypothetical protein
MKILKGLGKNQEVEISLFLSVAVEVLKRQHSKQKGGIHLLFFISATLFV